jgi:hypothetical protein
MSTPPPPGGNPDPSFPPPAPGGPPAPAGPGEGEELGEKGLTALRAERARAKDLETKLRELEPLAAKAREYEDSQKSEQQRLTDQLQAAADAKSAAEGETAKLQAVLLRHQVAAREGLTAAQAEFLSGTTEEEIASSVKSLRDAWGTTAPGARTPRQVEHLSPGAIPPASGAAGDINEWMRSKTAKN